MCVEVIVCNVSVVFFWDAVYTVLRPCVWQLQSEVRRSAEKYHTACVACDISKQTLIDIEQSTASGSSSSSSVVVGDGSAKSFSAEKQDSLNRATDEVSQWSHCSSLYYCSTLRLQDATLCLSVTLSNLNRFSKILHCWKALEICHKIYVTIPTSP